MTQDRKIINIAEIDRKCLINQNIVACDASHIRCKNLPVIRELLDGENYESIVVMPETDLKEGTSGYAKAQILASLEGVQKIIGTTMLQMEQTLGNEGGNVQQFGKITFSEKVVYAADDKDQELNIPVTDSQKDFGFIEMANNLIPESNCWWKPNACIFVRDSEVIASAVSSNPWCSDCKALQISSSGIDLKKGERIDFCDAIHAERLAVAEAAKNGISLKGTRVYVTSCPCEECAKVLIYTGVNTVIFGSDSYGLKDARLLINNGINLMRVSIK